MGRHVGKGETLMDWFVGGMTILAMELIGRKRWEGWVVGLINQVFWFWLVVWEQQLWGLSVLTVVLTWRYSAALTGVLASVGWVTGIMVNKRTGMVVDGHARVAVALRHNQSKVPVDYVDLSVEEEAEVLATYDTITALAGTDKDQLTALLRSVQPNDANIQSLLDDLAMQHQIDRVGTDDPAPKIDQAEALQKKWNTRPGQLWTIGQHRLLCGDATNQDHVTRLLAGKKPVLVVTDPPYGVQYDPTWRMDAGVNKNRKKMGTVQNDDRADWSQVFALIGAPVLYVWHGGLHAAEVQMGLVRVGYTVVAQIIWVKDRMALSRGDYHWQHEPCWLASNEEGEPLMYVVQQQAAHHYRGGRKQTTVWTIKSRDDSGHGHGTQKPVECMERPMRNNAAYGQLVCDPFMGSGTSLVAAQRSGRVCVGLELDPRYVGVALERMSDMGLECQLEK